MKRAWLVLLVALAAHAQTGTVITSTNPSSVTATCCSPALTLTINGINLLGFGSPTTPPTVTFNGTTVPVLTSPAPSNSQIRVSVPSSLLLAAGAAAVQVMAVQVPPSNSFPLTINAPPAITNSQTLPSGLVGAAYSVQLTLSGGTSPFAWTGSPPAGLTLSSSGKIAGTPAAAGSFSIPVQVVDAWNVTANQAFTLSVLSPLAIVSGPTLPAATVGALYFQPLQATGGTPPYLWSVVVSTLPVGLRLDGGSGTLVGTPTTAGAYTFTVQVMDATQATVRQGLILQINGPGVAITGPNALPNGTVGQAYTQTLNAGGGTPPFTWSILSGSLPQGIGLSPDTGVLGGTPLTAGVFPFTALVTDSAGATASRTFTLTVNPPGLSITTPTPLPGGTAGNPYSVTLAATGGAPPYTWAMTGTLPPGISLTAAGVLSGTPAAAGTFRFTVQATDTAQVSASQAYSLTITQSPLGVATASPLPAATVGTAYSQTLTASGGSPPYRNWSVLSGSLPPGLTLDGATGTLSGTPLAAATYNFTVQVEDSAGAKASKALALTVNAPPLAVATTSLANATQGTAYSQTLSATGGVPPYGWSLVSGALPAGLSLNAATGAIAGTPSAAGAYSFTVQVADTAKITASRQLSITVLAPPLRITTASPLPGGAVGSPYSQTLAASGGTPPYTWSASGTLPAGLALDPAAGAIGGTPAAGGNFTFAVQVTDSAKATASQTYALAIRMPPVPPISFARLPDTSDPGQQVFFNVGLASGYPAPLTGRLTLSFSPDAVNPADDQTVLFAKGGRTFDFTLDANATQLPDVGLQTGTVAGAITVTLSRLQAGSTDVTPAPAPSRTLRVGRSAPAITGVKVTRTGNGFEVQVTGFSTPREVTQATFRFTASSGATLQTADFTVPLGTVFTTWYRDPASAAFGSAFRYTQPFTVQGDAAAVISVTVTLSNAQGVSASASSGF